jgi:glycine/D-amino acid oxidase-like deaminating enzyme
LATDGGSVSAPKVLLATNGFTQDLGLPEARVVAMTTFASMTYPDGRPPGGGGWALVCEDLMGSTLRRTPDGRLLVRNTVRYSPRTDGGRASAAPIVAAHRRSLAARFPDLADLPFEFSWGGVVGVTANEVPYFGEIRPGVYLSAGCNGVGVSLAAVSGALLADLAAGVDSPLRRDREAIQKPSRVPPRVLLRSLAWAALHWMEWRAGADR